MSIPVTLSGRLGRDPDLHYNQQGKPFVTFSVCTSRRYRNSQSGEWEDADTTWWNCILFGQGAENVAESLLQGAAVIVMGKARMNEWTTRDGEQRRDIQVVVDEVAPSLRWASAKVHRAERDQPAQPAEDPWAGNPPPF